MRPTDRLPTFLARVEKRLATALGSKLPAPARGTPSSAILDEAAAWLCLGGGGKRARPALCFLLGEAVELSPAARLDLGAAAELVHAASLLHDDVVDEGTTRRGRPTVNARWGNAVAVLAGDLLLTAALSQLRRHPAPLTAETIELVAQMTRAAMEEVEARGRVDQPVRRWRGVAEGKTGLLFAWCGRSAARLAGDEDAAARFDRAGRRLGVAFQLADDLLDLEGAAGKDRFADVRSRTPSHPILVAAGKDARLRDRLARAWARGEPSREEAESLGCAVLATGAAGVTRARLAGELAAAEEALGPLRDRPGVVEVLSWARALGAAPENPRALRTAPEDARALRTAPERGSALA